MLAAVALVAGALFGLIGVPAAGTAAAAQPPANSTTVGGLDLAGYCASMGDTVLLKGNIAAPGAAYQWYCVTPAGKALPVNMATACRYQYPGQGTTPFAGDVNNAYSWVCITPTSGRILFGPGYVSYAGPTGTVVVSYSSGNLEIAFDGAGSTTAGATLVISPNGSGYLAFDGMGSGTAGVITFDGAGGTTAG